jgi:hypothetical protein
VLGSAVSYTESAGEHAMVRLSWRAVGERIEECRQATPAELAALPPHMRRGEICEGQLAPFRLKVAIDGSSVFQGRVRPGGLREDRPAYVLQEFRVEPGPHRLSVEFEPERGEGRSAPSRPPWVLEAQISPAPREIVLVTTGPEESGLILVQKPR